MLPPTGAPLPGENAKGKKVRLPTKAQHELYDLIIKRGEALLSENQTLVIQIHRKIQIGTDTSNEKGLKEKQTKT